MKRMPLLALALILMLGWSAFSDELETGVQIGQKALDFTLPQLDGEPITLSNVIAQNDATLLYFFFAAT